MSRMMRGALLTICMALLAPVAGLAQLSFIPGTPRQVPNGPSYVTTGDFNGDNIDDAVVISTVRDRVTVLFGSPFAEFESVVEIPVGSLLRGATVGDFNNDGKLDIAVTDVYSSRLFIINGNGNGTFSTPQSFPTDRRGPVSVVTGNFNGGGGLDAATANGAANTFTVFVNEGGNRGLRPVGNFPTGSNPREILAADINGDHVDDLITLDTGTRGTDEVSLYLNTGTGSFTGVIAQRYVVGVQAKAMAFGDFNGDRRMDIAVLNSQGSVLNSFSVSVLLGQENPTFQVLPPSQFTCPGRLNGLPIVCTPQDIAVADFDGDTRQDIAISFSTRATDNDQVTAGFVNVYTGRGNGQFEFATQGIVGLGPRQIAAADVTGDAVPDLTVTEFSANTVRVLRGKAPLPFDNGTPCVVGTQCASGNCVNGVCCSTINCPTGQRCDVYPALVSAPDGICRIPAPNGNQCGLDEQCASGHCIDGFCCASRNCPVNNFCNTGACGGPADNGTPCNADEQCSSGFCTDGFCCSSERCAVDAACNIPGNEGHCTTRQPPGFPCTDPAQCCSDPNDPTNCDPSFCEDGFCCETSCAPGETCAIPGREGECLPAPTPTATPRATATPGGAGAPCVTSANCAAPLFCTDGVCCTVQTCPNGSCSVPGNKGSCDQSPIGGPCDDSADCPSGAVCAPGSPNGTCQFPTPTPTRTPGGAGDGCTNNTQCRDPFVCNAQENPVICCNQAVCPTGQSCRVASNYGFCTTIPPTPTPRRNNGSVCTLGSTCESGNCVDNVCCEVESCTDTDRCDIPGFEGVCAPAGGNGQPCTKNGQCLPGFLCYGVPLTCQPPPSPTPTFITEPAFTPTRVVITNVNRSGGCAIDMQGSNNAGLLLSLLPLALWVRRRSALSSVSSRRN